MQVKWAKALEVCQQLDMKLVSILSEAENEKILDLIDKEGNFYSNIQFTFKNLK